MSIRECLGCTEFTKRLHYRNGIFRELWKELTAIIIVLLYKKFLRFFEYHRKKNSIYGKNAQYLDKHFFDSCLLVRNIIKNIYNVLHRNIYLLYTCC